MQGIIIVIILLVVIISLYLGSYYLNNNTPVPEGIEESSDCQSCGSISCSLHSNPNPKDGFKDTLSDYKK